MYDEADDSFGITLQVKAKHRDLYAAAKKLGGVKKLAEHLGVKYGTVIQWCGLRSMPRIDSLHRSSRWSDPSWKAEIEKKLFDLTGKTLDELFPEAIRDNAEFLSAPKVAEFEASISGIGIGHSRPLGLPSAEDVAIANEGRELVRDSLKSLSFREREIIKLRFGIGGTNPLTLEEVGKVFNVGRERIREIEAKAIRKLQQPSRSYKLADYIDVDFAETA